MGKVLGFDRYVSQGGDWGALITSWLALDNPERLKAIHLNSAGLAGGHDRLYDSTNPLDDPRAFGSLKMQGAAVG
jgi:pimeloyl-ACP methyl ester carboxylesterase